MLQEGGGGGIIGVIGSIIQGLLGIFGGGGPNPFVAVAGIGDISFSSLQLGTAFLREVTTRLKDIFKSVWETVIVGLLKKLLSLFTKIRNFLRSIFAPIIKWLKRLRAWYDAYFNKFVKPALRIIRHIRQFLQIFRLLGFKWAARLDARLADIENKIVKAYELLRINVNRVISWLDLIVDPTFLLRRNPLFGALIRSAQEMNNLALQTERHTITGDEADRMNRNRTWFLGDSASSNLSYYKQGQLPPDIQEARQQFLDVKLDTGDVQAG